MALLKERILPLAYILSIPLLSLMYGKLNNPNRGVHSLVTDLDNSIPFIKVFILPYIGWYLFLIATLVYLCWIDRSTYYKALLTIDIGMLISFGIYFIYQTTVPRPDLLDNDLLTQLVAFIYRTDMPYNCFPSIHSLTSFVLIKAIHSSKAQTPLNLLIITSGSLLIILSTLMVKQHVLLDALGAIVLGDLIFRLVAKLNTESLLSWPQKTFNTVTINREFVAKQSKA